jgi:hypothetical protein
LDEEVVVFQQQRDPFFVRQAQVNAVVVAIWVDVRLGK